VNAFEGGLRINGLAGMASMTVVAVDENCNCQTDLVGLVLDESTAYSVAAQLVEAVGEDVGAKVLAVWLRAKADLAEAVAGDQR
jgi:hypothetical protein